MKIRLLLSTAVLAPLALAAQQTPSAAPAAGSPTQTEVSVSPVVKRETPPAAAKPAPSTSDAIQGELSVIVERVKTKIQGGKSAAADLAEELKAFDDLSAKYSAEKTDAAATVRLMKAMLYLQVLEDQATGLAILKQAQKDFPGTEVAGQIPSMIREIEAQAAADAITAVGKEFAPFKETATDGTVIDLAAYRGKIVLVDFWATWCGPCVGELPHVKAAYEKYHDKGFEIIGISLDQDGDKLAAFTKENKMPWPQFFDGKGWQNKLANAYGIRSIPATFLLDREGKIAAKGLRGDALSDKIGELLAAKP